MEQMSTYSIKICQSAVHRKTLSATAGIYRKAVGFFIAVCLKEWDRVSTAKGQNGREHAVESLTVRTAKRKTVLYDFGRDFYKFPSYLRRAAIAEAAGKVSSYMSNLSAWEASDPRSRGKRPGYPSAGYAYPAMYRDNMFVRTGTYTARIKVFTRDTWDWLDVELCRGDADYILRHCGNRKECAPTLQKRGKLWYLDFSFKEDIKLPDRHCLPERIRAVDLGISSACACSVVCPQAGADARGAEDAPAVGTGERHQRPDRRPDGGFHRKDGSPVRSGRHRHGTPGRQGQKARLEETAPSPLESHVRTADGGV